MSVVFISEDQIRVIFTNVDEVDKNRQFTFDTKIVDSKYISKYS